MMTTNYSDASVVLSIYLQACYSLNFIQKNILFYFFISFQLVFVRCALNAKVNLNKTSLSFDYKLF